MTIDLNKIREISYLGIRRAEIFMGFGINSANNQSNNDFDLLKYTMYKLAPDIDTIQKIDECKTEFKKWIICNAFRELSDSFELYLDQIYNSVQYIQKQSQKKIKEYLHFGVSNKLSVLKNEYMILSEFSDGFDSINKVRNCLYHRRGIVGPEDINNVTQSLSIEWIGLDIGQISEDGVFEKFNYPITEPIEVKKGNSVIVIHNKRKKKYALYEEIKLTVSELSEICYFFKIETDNIYKGTMNFFKKKGVEIKEEKES